MGRRTPLYDLHVELGARMVDFGGWDMPVNYGSQIEEHHAVRRDAGIFDVSHMCVIDARGANVRRFLSKLIANDVAKLKTSGKALYSCMLNDAGGVIDDLIVYYIDESFFRIVVNAGTRDKDLAWMRKVAAPYGIELTERADLAMLAVQGPNARAKVAELLPAEHRDAALALEVFSGRQLGAWFVARTGYTGEDGFEIMLPAADAARTWRELNTRGVKSAGLGARDTLRLEAAMNLYGNDMDESQNPLESGLAWTVSFDDPARDFIGRKALEQLKAAGLRKKFVALVLDDRGVLRGHQKVIAAAGEGAREIGEITSGTFSPTMEKSIALARVARDTGATVQVDVRGKLLNARVVKAPFVRKGQVLVS
ncbi:MAG TPA: glycine cleavage system aminomethyltransferase GcvT [Steroidobacteraceae bacterium]|nr:glycine cleavage system aminomethyltransferase GcvT [Steroidobacteraceae bacterium]